MLLASITVATAGDALDRIDASTRWTVKMATNADIQTATVRLGDVASLVGRHAAWQRIAATPIAMIPSGSMTIKIDRDRLASVVGSFEATPKNIDWIGPATTTVTRISTMNLDEVRSKTNGSSPLARPTPIRTRQKNSGSNTRQSLSTNRSPSNQLRAGVSSRPVSPPKQTQSLQTPPSPTEVRRVSWVDQPVSPLDQRRWRRSFDSAIKRYSPEIQDRYAIEVVTPLTSEIVDSVLLQTHVTTPQPDGFAVAQVVTRSGGVSTPRELQLQLTPHPTVIVPAASIARGTRLTKRLFQRQTMPAENIPAGAITDIDDIVGMQATASLRSNVPITMAMIGEPVVVRRGDMVELKVIGGGVSVTTNARTLSDGVANELIEVETTERRKRVIARVINSSQVEIATKSPVVR